MRKKKRKKKDSCLHNIGSIVHRSSDLWGVQQQQCCSKTLLYQGFVTDTTCGWSAGLDVSGICCMSTNVCMPGIGS